MAVPIGLHRSVHGPWQVFLAVQPDVRAVSEMANRALTVPRDGGVHVAIHVAQKLGPRPEHTYDLETDPRPRRPHAVYRRVDELSVQLHLHTTGTSKDYAEERVKSYFTPSEYGSSAVLTPYN